jgi:hypothetical protein
MITLTISTEPHDGMSPIGGKKLSPDLDEVRKLGEKPGAGLDAADAEILRLLALGYPPQQIVAEFLDCELSDILRVASAGGAR